MFTFCKKTLALLTLATLSLLTACTTYEPYFEVRFEGDNATITDYEGISKVVTIPQKIDGRTVTKIGNGAFYGCTGLKKVTIPNGVTEIGDYYWDDNQGDIKFGAFGAFSYCTGLTEVTIPNSVTIIGEDAFYGCTGLKKVTIPNSVTEIGSGAFSGCTGLTEICVPRETNCSPNAFPGGCKVTRY